MRSRIDTPIEPILSSSVPLTIYHLSIKSPYKLAKQILPARNRNRLTLNTIDRKKMYRVQMEHGVPFLGYLEGPIQCDSAREKVSFRLRFA